MDGGGGTWELKNGGGGTDVFVICERGAGIGNAPDTAAFATLKLTFPSGISGCAGCCCCGCGGCCDRPGAGRYELRRFVRFSYSLLTACAA